MSFCLTEVFLWSLRTNLRIRVPRSSFTVFTFNYTDGDIGIHQYCDKKEPASQMKHSYLEEKQKLAESRDYPWILKTKRPDKLRDALKEVEDLMQSSPCVLSKWKNKHTCQLLFHSGILVSLSLSGPQLEKVVIDRTLVGKLISDTISDVYKDDGFSHVNKRLEKLSCLDSKISYVDIRGPEGRRMKRHLAINCTQDLVICWWSATSDEAWPWSPISCQRDRANLLLLCCAHGKLEVLSYVRTEWDPLDARFSCLQPRQVLTVEHSVSAAKEPMADSCVYKCVRNRIQCTAVTRIPLPAKATSCCRDVTEDKLVLGCEDSSVVLYEAYGQVTLLAQAELLPAVMTYHPSGAVLVVGSSQGELQLFDTALSPIKIQLLAQDYSPEATLQFSKHCEVPTSLIQIQWATSPGAFPSPDSMEIHDLLLVRFDKGPLGVLHFKLGVLTRGQLGLVEIIHQYIRYDEIQEAVNVLSTMNWNTMGQKCFICLSAICNHLLRQKLTPAREAQLEASLGTFYAPTRPLLDGTVLEYRDPISRYARRFFHHLLRSPCYAHEDDENEEFLPLPVCQGKPVLQLDPHESMGLDGIHLRALQELADVTVTPVSMIFELSWESGEVTTNQKLANIVPVFREGKKDDPGNCRYQRFEKAFLLAVDIGARDLFMDIHYLALDKGELALAEVAKRKANDIDAESITTGIEVELFVLPEVYGNAKLVLAPPHRTSPLTCVMMSVLIYTFPLLDSFA
ncbi:hypothetical protein DUI87_15300 [Hirundo rustica rustica]|uniref:WD repeat-containing and planar cell polarity effector protein fritz homolog n=1 Tax=Hirundo rustica rustica TaxID=333673 RepID=A0A3M0K5P5_HIRRU|nr:hypothetical protein DUI87_15300 [Hirundo rustica rustica]